MSRVISFRLDRDNPREAQALAILTRWQEQGYSLRHILTEALTRLDSSDDVPRQDVPVDEIVSALNQIQQQLERIQESGHIRNGPPSQTAAALSEAFLGSVRQAARSGIQFSD